MTFNQIAQGEDIHIGAWPYMPDANDSTAQYWEQQEVNWAAAKAYAINSAAVNVGPGVGAGAIWNAQAQVLATVEAAVPYNVQPIVYATVNTTAFANVPYSINGDESWGILEQITGAYPSYIPREHGTFVDRVTNPISSLVAAANNFTKTTGEKATGDNFTASATIPTVPTYTSVPAASATGSASANSTALPTAVAAVATSTSGADSIARSGALVLAALGAALLIIV